MNEKQLDELLEQVAASPVPGIPGNLADRVWRKIRQRSDEKSAIPGFWPRWLFQPQFALGLLLASFGFGALRVPLLPASAADHRQQVRQALALEVFATNPPGTLRLFHQNGP